MEGKCKDKRLYRKHLNPMLLNCIYISISGRCKHRTIFYNRTWCQNSKVFYGQYLKYMYFKYNSNICNSKSSILYFYFKVHCKVFYNLNTFFSNILYFTKLQNHCFISKILGLYA